jgi:hypothetical protein
MVVFSSVCGRIGIESQSLLVSKIRKIGIADIIRISVNTKISPLSAQNIFIPYRCNKNSPKPQGSKLFQNQTIIQTFPSLSLPRSLPSTYLWQTPCSLQAYPFPTTPDLRPFRLQHDLFALI